MIMRSACWKLSLLVWFLVSWAYSQQVDVPSSPEFDAVSLRSIGSLQVNGSTPGEVVFGRPLKNCKYFPERMACELTLGRFIEEAHGVKDRMIIGSGWVKEDIFVMSAIYPPGTSVVTAKLMLQRMMKERFGLSFHRETKDQNAYALVAAESGPKLKEVKEPEIAPKRDVKIGSSSISASMYKGPGIFFATAMSLDQLAQNISSEIGTPVVNMTALSGSYEINLRWTPDPTPGPNSPGSDNLFIKTIQQQLGLRLVKRKLPTELFVVDTANRMPTGN